MTLVDERREQFKKDVAALGLDSASAGSGGGKGRIIGLTLMIVGAVAAFVIYIASLTLSDSRDLMSYQLLSIGFIALTLIGGFVYLAAAVTRVLSLWLVRQLLENNAQAEKAEKVDEALAPTTA